MKNAILFLLLVLIAGCSVPAMKKRKVPPPPPALPGMTRMNVRPAAVTVVAPPDSQFVFSKRFGDVANDTGGAVAVDRNGNVFIAGTITISSGSAHPFLAKLNPAGSIVWSNIFDGNGTGSAVAVATDKNGDVILAGSFIGSLGFGPVPLVSTFGSQNIFVAKFAGDGTSQWSKRFGTTVNASAADDAAHSVIVDTNDNAIVVTGRYGSDCDFGNGPLPASSGQSLFVARLNPNGTARWSKGVTSSAFSRGNSVATDASGVYVTGNFLISGGRTYTVDFGDGPVPVTGNEMFIAKYTHAGTHVWAKKFGRSAIGQSLAIDRSHNVVVVGSYQVDINFGGQTLTNPPPTNPLVLPSSVFLAKFTPNGAHVFSRRLAGTSISGMAIRPAGDIIMTSSSYTMRNFAEDGTLRWAKDLSGSQLRGVAVDAAGRSYVVGDFAATVNFGGGPMASAGGRDIFLATYGSSSAAVVPTGTMEISEKIIDPENGSYFIVSDIQQVNMTIEFRMQTRPGGPRQTIGTWSAYPESSRVGVSLQAGLPVAWVDSVQTAPAPSVAATTVAPRSVATDTGRVVKSGGSRYRVFQIKPGMFKLVKL